MLDFRHETFLSLCRIRNYTKTAEFLCITQPAVSQHIKYLEEQYGGKLFLYEGKTLKLTERGIRLQEYALTAQADSSYIRTLLTHLDTTAKEMSFGATLSIGEYVMPQIMTVLLQKSLDTSLHMQVNNTQSLLQKLHDGDIRFALLEGYFDKAKYDWALFSKEVFIPVCSPSSPLAKPNVQLADILEQRLFIRENGSGTREILEQMLQEQNHTIQSFRDVCVIGNLNRIKRLVEHNLGITFLYKVAADQEIANGTLTQIKFKDFTVWRAFHFVFLKNSLHRKEYLDWYRFFQAARPD